MLPTDLLDRLRPAAAPVACADRIGSGNGIDAEVSKLTVEEAMIGAAAELAVRHQLEAELLLQPDCVADGKVFRGGQLGLCDLASCELGTLPYQVRRA